MRVFESFEFVNAVVGGFVEVTSAEEYPAVESEVKIIRYFAQQFAIFAYWRTSNEVRVFLFVD